MYVLTYATKVKVLRSVQGWSQGDLARACGIANFDLSKIETGKMLPSEAWDQRIRSALGWTPAVDAALDALAEALASEREEAA